MTERKASLLLILAAIFGGIAITCIGAAGMATVTLGPGSLGDGAHGYDEFVPRQELVDAARIYAQLICDYCS